MLSRDDINNIFSSFLDDTDEILIETPAISGKAGTYDEFFCAHCQREDALIIVDGQYECKLCGVKQEHKLNMEQEWRFYGDSDTKGNDPNRVGMPTNSLLPESSLGSVIAPVFGEFSRLRQYHQYNIMPYRERSLWNTFTDIQNKCLHAGIANIIIDDAKTYYKMVSEQKISRGSNRKGIKANCAYFACKKNGVPRSIKEMSEIFGISVSEMTRGKKKFEEIINQKSKETLVHVVSTNPFDYIDRFCSNLNIDLDMKYICQFVVFNAIRLDILDDNTPPSIAAGAIFLISSVLNLGISKTMVHQATKISAVTISKCFKKLNTHKESLFPMAAIQKYNIEFNEKNGEKKKQYRKKAQKESISANNVKIVNVI
jgi:transcription initiation factor TFIIB